MMTEQKKGFLVRFFGGMWGAFNGIRRLVFGVIALILLFTLLAAMLSDDTPKVPDRVALVISPAGSLVEELTGTPGERALMSLLGELEPEALAWDLLESLERAREDERVEAVFLELSGLGPTGLSKLQEIHRAIQRVREAGKTVVAYGEGFSQGQYYLASAADEIVLNPMSAVEILGFGSYRNYYKEAIDRFDIDWHVFKVGEYKSGPEPFFRDGMSEEAREARLEFLTALWDAYKADVAAARGLTAEAIQSYVVDTPERLVALGGDTAALALEAGLVDRIGYRDEVRERLIELVGTDEADDTTYSGMDYETYLAAVDEAEPNRPDQVAVVVASGTILDGSQSPGTVGGDSTASLLRAAREDDEVKAVVLRVDSPGGSAFASEVIRREVELLRAAGKPVVSSMSSVAASGGYWISMSTDEIWASPTTITGSIGIYGSFPTFSRAMAKWGVRNDGVGTTPLAGGLQLERELTPEIAAIFQSTIERGYQDFITKAAAGRDMTVEDLDKVARGRVWMADKGVELGLVDQLGGLDDAVESAARLAGIEGDYQRVLIQQEVDSRDAMIANFLTRVQSWVGHDLGDALPRSPEARLMRRVARDLEPLLVLDDPRGQYAHCLCDAGI